MKQLLFFLAFVFLTACVPASSLPMGTPVYPTAPLASPRPSVVVTPTPSATSTPTADPFASIRVKQTEIGMEAERIAMQEQQLGMQLTVDAATSQAGATKTAIVEKNALGTASAKTKMAAQVSGTQTAFPLTQTPMVATQQILDQRLVSEKVGIWAGRVFSVFMEILVVICAIIGLYLLVDWMMKRNTAKFISESAGAMKPDPMGRHPATPAHVPTAFGSRPLQIHNVNIQHRATAGAGIKDDLSTAQALENVNNQRKLEAVRAVTVGNIYRHRSASPSEADASRQLSEGGPLPSGLNIPLPAWEIINGWDGKGLPYGVGERGLLTMQLSDHAHVATIGKTGAGKSRRFLRPFLTCALAAGQRVIVIGKQADFQPFMGHPNATLIALRQMTIPDEAKRYAYILRAIVEEMNRRDEYLTTHHQSTWERAGMENTIICLDELGNAIDLMPSDYSKTSMRFIIGMGREGRKVGMNMLFASQRAVGFRPLMTQVGRAVFFVEDEMESRMSLGAPGAETLRDGYFYAKFGEPQLVAAFEPSDEEIKSFLASRPQKMLERPKWIEGIALPETQPPQIETKNDRVRDLEIWRRHLEGQTLNEIQRAVFNGKTGGSFYNAVTEVIARYKANTTSTTTPEMPSTGTLAA